jgi:RHS repeat-associated protein
MVTNYYSVDGEVIGEKVAGGTRLDYLTDALGSISATVDQSGSVVNRYSYKPFGMILQKSGSGADPSFLWAGSHGYRQTGNKYSDIYVRARHYDTVNGRWTTKDPIDYDNMLFNPYTYANDSPVTAIDPTGLYTIERDKCIKGSYWICVEPGDSTAVAANYPKPKLINAETAFKQCSSCFDEDSPVIGVNGGFFDLDTGKPLGPLVNCRGKGDPNNPDPKIWIEIGSLHGVTSGHVLRLPDGKCIPRIDTGNQERGRNAACLTKGKLCFFIIADKKSNPPAAGLTLKELCKCMDQLCPHGIGHPRLLDGGGSTQIYERQPGQKLRALIRGERPTVRDFYLIGKPKKSACNCDSDDQVL